MKVVYLLSLGLLLCFSSYGQQSTHGANLLWSDEFDQDGLPSDKKWSFEVGDHGWGNNELQ
ncbi:MAG: glycoside hydrolase family 16 protein, partial [Algoriphagus sp.]|nr:glycoside hydrolase family 16 protein [Algoriphagus sp.]